MTALHQYSRLEASGLWRNAIGAQRREVIVGLRKATIVLLDPKTEMPLTQWSLPAIIRLHAVDGVVTYASHEEGDETLEIDDPTMVAALDKVRQALDRRRKRPGRLRAVITITSLSVLAGLTAMWIPLRLYDFTAARLPDALRRDIAAAAMRDIATISGTPCAGTMGVAAAGDLTRRIVVLGQSEAGAQDGGQGQDGPQNSANLTPIAVLREGLPAPASLPDGTVLLPFDLVEQVDGPDTLAGYVLAQRVLNDLSDPMLPALRYAGLWATFRLLANGALPPGALAGYGLALAARTAPVPNAEALHRAFQEMNITSLPYAHFAADAMLMAMPDAAPAGSQPIVLEDAAFLGLQYICDS